MSAVLTVLGNSPAANHHVSISMISGQRLRIADGPHLPLGTPVKVTEADCLWLGEVIETHPAGEMVIEIQHSIDNVSELVRLTTSFLEGLSSKPKPKPTLS